MDIHIFAAKSNDARSNQGGFANQMKSVTNVQTDASNMERINRWLCAGRMFMARPVTGWGPGTYQYEYGQFQSVYEMTYISTRKGDRGNAHSEYLTYLSETGAPGFLIWCFFVLFTVYRGMRIYYYNKDPVAKKLGLAALLGISTFFFHGIFNSFIDQEKMASLVFMSLAIIVAIEVYHTDGNKELSSGNETN